jgi:predicted restriction endonuclease
MYNKFIKEINEEFPLFTKRGKQALHKPLLLLQILADIYNGKKNNHFLFIDYEDRLEFLLRQFGWEVTKTYNPHYPFYFLKSSPFWSHDIKNIKHKDAPSKPEVRSGTGELRNSYFKHLSNSRIDTGKVIKYILNRYWPDTIHNEILYSLSVNLNEEIIGIEQVSRTRCMSF